jgi:putative transposase
VGRKARHHHGNEEEARSGAGRAQADDAKRLKDLERENAALKRLLADAELEKAALKEIAAGNF